LETVVIPPNKPSQRDDMSDQIYLTAEEKYEAIVDAVKVCNKKGQPVLVGTSSIESSELISSLLKKNKINHEVLNAKQHEREAQIVANAGAIGSVTIATNMAGRGTDIVLGGRLKADASEKEKADWIKKHEAVKEAGGLHIVGTERNESRRVDNQLRGRAGRQGDVGSTRFYLSLQDSLMRIFASEKMASMMQRLGMERGEAIEHKMVNRAIENAQKKVEGMNYDARKQLLEYDDVANDQRKVIYKLRNELTSVDEVTPKLYNLIEDIVPSLVYDYLPSDVLEEEWDIDGLHNLFKSEYGINAPISEWLDSDMEVSEVADLLVTNLKEAYEIKSDIVGKEQMNDFAKAVMLQVLDHYWKEHLASMDYLRQSVNLRGYAQKNPIQEFKKESFEMFTDLLETIDNETLKTISVVSINKETSTNDVTPEEPQEVQYQHSSTDEEESKPEKKEKIGRNEPCPCGSGKKYKQCHGKS